MSIETLFGFLGKNWLKLPPWLRNATYVVLLALFVYLMLFPTYIDGRLVVPTADGQGSAPFLGDGFITVHANGRRLEVRTDEKSEWHVPLTSRVPFKSARIDVIYNGSQYPVIIPYLRLMDDQLEVEFHEGERNLFRLKAQGSKSGAGVANFSLVSTAFAAEQPAKTVPNPDKAADKSATLQLLISEATKQDRADRIGDAEQSQLFQKINHGLDVQLTKSAWRTAVEQHSVAGLVLNAEAPVLPATAPRDFTRILASYLPQDDFYVGKNIPEEKLKSALQSRANGGPKSNEVIGLVDGTFFGSATLHLIFADNGLYFKTGRLTKSGEHEGFIAYEDFPKLTFGAGGWNQLTIGKSQSIDLFGSDMKAVKLVDLLNDLKTAILTAPRTTPAAH